MSVGLTFDFLSTALVAAQVAFHQSSGFCSLQPGLGVEIGCSAVAVARTLPSSSQTRVFVPLVPMSMPSKWAMGILRDWIGERSGEYSGVVMTVEELAKEIGAE